MVKIKIQDSLFGHTNYSTLQESNSLSWDRTAYDNNDLVVFTDHNLVTVNPNIKTKIAWLLESTEITKNAYNWIRNNNHKFDYVLTYNKEFLDRNENFIFCPVGGCWINPSDQKIYKKSKNISIIASNKKMTYGHRLRHEIINKFKNIDVFGRAYNPIQSKLVGLKDYRYSIVVENTKVDYYFTEKLIDCFATGTVPIYYGCPSIGDFFDTRGMIIINSILDLDNIIYNLSENTYFDMLEYVKINFERMKEYLISENYIFNILKNKNII